MKRIQNPIQDFNFVSVYDEFTIIVQSLTFSNFTLITSMFIVKLTLFFRYADWSTCHFERFSIFVLQRDCNMFALDVVLYCLVNPVVTSLSPRWWTAHQLLTVQITKTRQGKKKVEKRFIKQFRKFFQLCCYFSISFQRLYCKIKWAW